MAEEKLGSIKRFGARYGRTVKYNFGKIEQLQRQTYACPYCAKQQVKRIAVGIWRCMKCASTFTGKAYTLSSSPLPLITKEATNG